jgi:Icc protein
MSNVLKIIQFTDTHLYKDASFLMRGVDTYSTFKQTVELALSKEGVPDFVLLTGDISMDETVESYDRVREIVEPIGAPIYFLPGNHDCFETMQLRFLTQPSCEPSAENDTTNIKADRSFVHGRWLFVLLDSVLPGKVEGYLRDDELARLDRELSEHSDLNALVCLHHNVIPITADPEEDRGLQNSPALLEVLDKHSNVRGVLWGHVHGEYSTKRHDIPFMATPSTCIQFIVTGNDVDIDSRPPGYRQLTLTPEGSIHSRVEWLAELPHGLEVGRLNH